MEPLDVFLLNGAPANLIVTPHMAYYSEEALAGVTAQGGDRSDQGPHWRKPDYQVN